MYRPSRTGFNRVPFVAGCAVTCSRGPILGVTCNLSTLGIFVHSDVRPEEQESVRLTFELPDDGPAIDTEAKVTWVKDAPSESIGELPAGFGLRFVSLPPEDVRRLAALVAAFQASPGPQVGIDQPFTGRVRIPFVESCTLRGAFVVVFRPRRVVVRHIIYGGRRSGDERSDVGHCRGGTELILRPHGGRFEAFGRRGRLGGRRLDDGRR